MWTRKATNQRPLIQAHDGCLRRVSRLLDRWVAKSSYSGGYTTPFGFVCERVRAESGESNGCEGEVTRVKRTSSRKGTSRVGFRNLPSSCGVYVGIPPFQLLSPAQPVDPSGWARSAHPAPSCQTAEEEGNRFAMSCRVAMACSVPPSSSPVSSGYVLFV